MKFKDDHVYYNRVDETLRLVPTRGKLPAFRSVETDKVYVTNEDGRYRWDGKDHDLDIVGSKKNG